MPEDPLEERLAAVERALDDGVDTAGHELADRVADIEDDVAELEAAVQAVRGYVGSVRAVNDEVEERADAAMAKAEAVERRLARDRRERRADRARGGPVEDRRASADAHGTSEPDSGVDRRPTEERPPTGATAAPDGDARGDRPCPHCGGTDDTRAPHDGSGSPEDGTVAGNDERPLPGEAPGVVGTEYVGANESDDEGGLLAGLREVL